MWDRNRKAVEKSGLVVSHLLKVAKRVIANPEEKKTVKPGHQ